MEKQEDNQAAIPRSEAAEQVWPRRHAKAELRSDDERSVSMTSHLIGAEMSDGNQNSRPADQPMKPSLYHSLREDTASTYDFRSTPF
jgi:hypothetical protein